MSEELGKDIPVDVRITEMPKVTGEPEGMKDARLERAGAVEHARVDRAAVVETVRVDSAKHVQRQMVFLFVLLFIAFLALAYRSETNARSIEQADALARHVAYDACLARVERTDQIINPGRVALSELLLKIIATDETLSAQQLANAADVLRDGLIVPLETCTAPT